MGDEKSASVSADEVIRFFKTEAPHIHLSVDSLMTPESAIKIYRFFIQSLTMCKDEALDQITKEDQQQIEFEVPQLHENSYPLLKLVLAIDYMFEKLGFSQYVTIKDLTNPTRKRLLGNISILMQFYIFVKGRKYVVDGILEKSKEIRDEKALLVKRNIELKERINNIRMEKAKQEPMLNKIKSRQADLRTYVKEKKAKMGTVKKEEEKLADEEKSLIALLTEKRLAKDSLESKDSLLSSQMVSSPEKLSVQLDALKKQAAEKEQQLEALNVEISNLVSRRKDLPRVDTLLDSLLTSLDKISEEIAKKDELMKKHENLSDQIWSLNLKLKDLTLTRNGCKDMLASRCEQYSKFQQQQNARALDLQKEISTLKEQIVRTEQEIKENDVVSSSFDEEARKIRKEIMTMEREHETTLSVFNEKDEQLMAALDKMNKDESELNVVVNELKSDSEDEIEIDNEKKR